MLQELKARGFKLAILSNGSPSMLDAVIKNSGLEGVFDGVFSVEEVGVYKPHPSVYALAAKGLSLDPSQICFLSSNGWDAFSAKAFGFQTLWCNRFGQPPERIPATPDGEILDLSVLPPMLK